MTDHMTLVCVITLAVHRSIGPRRVGASISALGRCKFFSFMGQNIARLRELEVTSKRDHAT